MAYPPTIPAADITNTTPQVDRHPADHNGITNGMRDIVNELGTNPSGTYSTVQERLGKIWPGFHVRTIVDNTQATGATLPTPSTITPFNIPITPVAASSSFFLRASLTVGASGFADDCYFWFVRNGALIQGGSGGTTVNAGTFHRFSSTGANSGALDIAHVTFEGVDSPNTTGVVNYTIAWAVRTTNPAQAMYLNRRGQDTTLCGTSSFTVQEIVA